MRTILNFSSLHLFQSIEGIIGGQSWHTLYKYDVIIIHHIISRRVVWLFDIVWLFVLVHHLNIKHHQTTSWGHGFEWSGTPLSHRQLQIARPWICAPRGSMNFWAGCSRCIGYAWYISLPPKSHSKLQGKIWKNALDMDHFGMRMAGADRKGLENRLLTLDVFFILLFLGLINFEVHHGASVP